MSEEDNCSLGVTIGCPPAASATLATALGLPGADALFPWQRKLLARFLAAEEIPRSLDIPTGLGKTAVMAIWLVARAWGASLPRRLVYVVDRRAVVDQATSVADELRSFVDRTPTTKERLGLAGRSLPISTLRGQHVDNREWLEDPATPAIVVGTVDMVGSRLLFQGYGVSRRMRPYHAALLGIDALVVLDEAHLAMPLQKLLERIAQDGPEFGPENEERGSLAAPLRLISLSATGTSWHGKPFRLGACDFKHEVARLRLGAAKRVVLRNLGEDGKLVDALADAAWELAGRNKRPVRCIVFCDRREDAAKCKQAIDRRAKDEGVEIDTELFVGARRVRERTGAALRLESLGFLAGKKTERTRASVLFATSAGEVGVDLDADCMTCDLVAWERMVQRLGRVNRRGDVQGGAKIVVITAEMVLGKKAADADDAKAKTVAEHEALFARREALELLPRVDHALDASPGAVLRLREKATGDERTAQVLGRATTPEPLGPELSRALVEAWAMTSLKDHAGRPEVEPWLRGWSRDEPQTRIVWRTHLPVGTPGSDATKLDIEGFFAVAPPHASEMLETETRVVQDWLVGRAETLSPRAEGGAGGSDDDRERLTRCLDAAVALTRAGDLQRTLGLGDLIAPTDKKDRKHWSDKLRGDLVGMTLVVDARLGGLTTDGLLDTKAAGVPPTVDGGGPWSETSATDGKAGMPTVGFRVRIAEGMKPVSGGDEWAERLRLATAMSEEGDETRWLVVETRRHDVTSQGQSVTRPELLEEHQRRVEGHARTLAEKLGLSPRYAGMLASVARVHDEGKTEPRWQRAFNAPTQAVYGKTAGPISYALLDGYRHELGTVLRVSGALHGQDPELRDLALQIIAAHHGFARPFIGLSGCDVAPPSVLERHAQEIAVRFARLQERWGPWGLAWWEALLRAADQRASRESVAKGEAG